MLWQCATNKTVSGPKEIRTPDPLIANEVLYQLSYGPVGHEYSTALF